MNRFKKQNHCTYCGHRFQPGQPWPRRCQNCQKISFANPLPVAVVLVPVEGGLLLIRRGIRPGKGELALPGGFIELDETWQQAAVRELHEETGLLLDAGLVTTFSVRSDPAGFLLVFGLAPPLAEAQLPVFTATPEVTELVIQHHSLKLAFPLHTEAMQNFFERKGQLRIKN